MDRKSQKNIQFDYLIDTGSAVIIDKQATPFRTYDAFAATENDD
jgi:hypothetical protein